MTALFSLTLPSLSAPGPVATLAVSIVLLVAGVITLRIADWMERRERGDE